MTTRKPRDIYVALSSNQRPHQHVKYSFTGSLTWTLSKDRAYQFHQTKTSVGQEKRRGEPLSVPCC